MLGLRLAEPGGDGADGFGLAKVSLETFSQIRGASPERGMRLGLLPGEVQGKTPLYDTFRRDAQRPQPISNIRRPVFRG
jgi:hypothetical protein